MHKVAREEKVLAWASVAVALQARLAAKCLA